VTTPEVSYDSIHTWFSNAWRAHGDPPRHRGWRKTINVFIGARLAPDDLLDAIQIAMEASHIATADKWPYFCGICWNWIRPQRNLR
jgi:hypothetical protein